MSQNSLKNSLKNGPTEKGYYGEFGGRYAPEILMPNLIELEKAFEQAINDKIQDLRCVRFDYSTIYH